MDMIKYQFADPQQIMDLNNEDFSKLVKNKVYVINLNFVNSEQCMQRLVNHLLQLPIGKQTLKLVKDLVKHFQSPILYSLRQFYSKHKKYFKSLIKSENQRSSSNSDNKQLKLLQQIGFIYMKLTDGQQEIQEFKFFTEYGVINKDVVFTKKDQKYQTKYLRWLKKSLLGLQVLKKQPPTQKAKIYWVQRTQKEFEQLVQNKDSVWLQRFSMEDIIDQSQNIPDFHKNISKKQNQQKQSNTNLNGSNINLNDLSNTFYNNDKSFLTVNKNLNDKKQTQNLNQISPSLRRFFYENQNLSHAEDVNLQYKNFKAPYDKYCVKQLRRAICGFLNRGGGVILVGVKEDNDVKSRVVKGQILSEYKKQQVLFQFKYICQQIQPDIISQGKYHIKFVPIKKQNGNYIQGKYIVRVQIARGDTKCLYTINQDNQDWVVFRTGNQVLRRAITQKTLLNFKMRLLEPPRHPPLPPCPQPEIGIPLLQDKHETMFNQKHQYCPDQDQYQECYKNPYYESKQKWKLKTDPFSPPTRQKTKKDFVYFNPSNTNAKNSELENKDNTKRKFFCDEDDNQEQNDYQELKAQFQDKSINTGIQTNSFKKKETYSDKNLLKDKNQNQEDELDFKPINPVPPKRQYKQSKQFFQPFERKQTNYIPKPDPKNFQSYEVDRASLTVYTERPSSLDILVIGISFETVNQVALELKLPLIQPPILCNYDFVTWLCLNSRQAQMAQKTNQFMAIINKKWMNLPQGKQKMKIKIRKLFSNVYFQDQILLNKFIHKFGHDQQFCDQRGVYYYACKDKQQAIQAYMIGYELDIKIKFLSSEDLKAKKIEHLKSKVQKRENQKNQKNRETQYLSDFL